MLGRPARVATDLLPQAVELRPALRRFLARRVPESDVDDLLQEIFLHLSKSRSDAQVLDVTGYVFRIAANVVAEYGRRRGTRPIGSGELSPDVTDDEGFAPDRIIISRQELQQAMRQILALPERTRDIFMLHRFEHMSYPEIAGLLGISVSAVEKHIMKALSRLSGPSEIA